MPAILEKLVKQLKAKGYSDNQAWAIGTAALQRSGKLKKKNANNRSSKSTG